VAAVLVLKLLMMGACARNMWSDSAEIKPAQCCIKLVFHLTCIIKLIENFTNHVTKIFHEFQIIRLGLIFDVSMHVVIDLPLFSHSYILLANLINNSCHLEYYVLVV